MAILGRKSCDRRSRRTKRCALLFCCDPCVGGGGGAEDMVVVVVLVLLLLLLLLGWLLPVEDRRRVDKLESLLSDVVMKRLAEEHGLTCGAGVGGGGALGIDEPVDALRKKMLLKLLRSFTELLLMLLQELKVLDGNESSEARRCEGGV